MIVMVMINVMMMFWNVSDDDSNDDGDGDDDDDGDCDCDRDVVHDDSIHKLVVRVFRKKFHLLAHIHTAMYLITIRND